MTAPITYSRGRNINDNRPRQLEVPDFAAFVAALDADRAPRKTGAGYVAGPLNGDGLRCAEGAMPRRFLAVDIDRIEAARLPDLRMWFAGRFSGFAWSTHSSTREEPRDRVIIELDREADRAECMAVGRTLTADLAQEFGAAVFVDPSTFRGEQPVFLPPTGATLARFFGDPLDVDRYVQAAPPPAHDAPRVDAETGEIHGKVQAGGRHQHLARKLSDLNWRGIPAAGIRAALHEINERECEPPQPRGEVDELVSDWLRRYGGQHGRDRVHGGARREQADSPPPEVDAEPTGIRFSEVPLADLATATPEPQRWWWAGYVPAGHVTLWAGHGGAGKSTLALMLGASLALGRAFLGQLTTQARVLFFSAEDPAALVRLRLAKLCRAWGVDPVRLAEHMLVIDATELDAALYVERRLAGVRSGGTTPTYDALREYLEAKQIDVLIADNASDLFDADEIVRQLVRGFIRSLAHLVRARGGAVVLLAHVDKLTSRAGKAAGGEAYSGSTALHNSVRSRLFLLEKEPGVLELQHQKANLGPKLPPVQIEWPEGELPRMADEPEGTLGAVASGLGSMRQVLALVGEFYSRGEWVPTTEQARPNALRLLAAERGYPGNLKGRELWALLRDAERRRLLVREAYRNAERKERERWALTPAGRAVVDGHGPLFTGQGDAE